MNEHHTEVWMAVAGDHTRNMLRDVALTRLSRDLHDIRHARRAWLSRQTGRVLRGVGARMVSLGKQLEFGCDTSVLTPPEVKLA